MMRGIKIIVLLLGVLTGFGCAHRQVKVTPPAGPVKGVYHKVRPGETLWRIAKSYDVSMDDLIRSNNIPNVAMIEKNQLIFIPGADHVKTITVENDLRDGEFIWPLKGKVISYFGETRNSQPNKGIDIQAREGDTVCAARGGKVVFADYLTGYAFTVILDHLDGLYSVYSQNTQLLVKLNDAIVKGTPIATAGGSGGQSFLHFQIRKKSNADNPLYYLPR